MITTHNLQFTVPMAHPDMREEGQSETVSAVKSAPASDDISNDLQQEQSTFADRRAADTKAHLKDPSAPVGPPPAFSANVLEAERERQKSGERNTRAEETNAQGTSPDHTSPTVETETSSASLASPLEAYSGKQNEMAHTLDLSR